jgi:hypothetical protein
MPVIRENVISGFHSRVAREPALGVVPLRRLGGQGAGRERIGCRVILEHGVSPPSAVGEPLAVLHHEVDVMLGGWHRRRGAETGNGTNSRALSSLIEMAYSHVKARVENG